MNCVTVTNRRCCHETLNSWATLEATWEEERLSSSTCFSTPRSANIGEYSRPHVLRKGMERTKAGKHASGGSGGLPDHDGQVWVVLLDDGVLGDDELAVLA